MKRITPVDVVMSRVSLILGAAILVAGYALPSHASSNRSEFFEKPISKKSTVPTFGLQISASPSDLGNRSFNFRSVQKNYSTTFIDLVASYYIPLQAFGAINVGPTLKASPSRRTFADASKPNLVFAWAYGAQVQYQAKYIESQILVPTIGLSAERWLYKLKNAHDQFSAWGPTAGLMLDLNLLDPSLARSMKNQTGIIRTYLVAEYQRIQGATRDQSGSLSGENVQVGLRFDL